MKGFLSSGFFRAIRGISDNFGNGRDALCQCVVSTQHVLCQARIMVGVMSYFYYHTLAESLIVYNNTPITEN